MKLRLVAISALVVIPVIVHAQQGGPPPNVPKPTRADVQKVVQILTRDKAKIQAYCDLTKLYAQMGAAEQKNDSKTVEALGRQADALVGKVGPEYSKLMGGLVQVDPNSSEGKEFMSMLSGLNKRCTNPTTQSISPPAPSQPAPTHIAQPVPLGARPCAQIRAACTQAGFVRQGGRTGAGLGVDCIRPIMAGTPQRKGTTKPLPQIDPQLLAACKQQNPNFGMGGGGQPTTKPSGT
jgi:hypothetical protein